MAAREYLQALFQNDQRLRRFLLPDVRSTGRELGTGAYGVVEEVEVGGLVCAGKKIHNNLLQPVNIAKYVEECQLMSDLRHPHVVQFMGICFLPPAALPVLVMEKLHMSLDDLLTRYARHPPLFATPDIPLCLKWSFLVDILKGLDFLHRHSPSPIVHRDLSARNILLSLSMVAKISDLGNSRMVGFQPGHLALSQVPGTPVYMPPEAFETPPCYGPKLDLFSFGHLMLYTLIQVFPCNLLAATYPNAQNPRGPRFGRSEVERREGYITQLHQQLGEGHPLVQLVEQCLANEAEDRPSAEEVLQQLEQMDIDDPYQGLTRLDMIRMVGQNEEEIQQKDVEIQRRDEEIQRREEEIQRNVQESRQKDVEIQQRDEEIQRREEEIQRNVQESQQQDVEIQRREEEIQRRDEEIQQKEQAIEQMGEEVRQRDVVIHHGHEEIQRKEDEVRQKSEEIRRKDGEKQSLQSQVQQLQAQVLKVEVNKTARVETLTNQVQGLEERVHQLDSEKERAQAQVQLQAQLIYEKERAQAQHTSEVETLSERVSALGEDNSNLSSLVEAKTISLGVKVQQMEVLRRELVVKERQVEGKGKEVEVKQQQIDSVTQQAQALTKVVHSLQEQLSAKEQELSATKDASRDQLSAKEQELSAHQQQIEGIAQERDALQLELVPLREGLQTKDAEIAVQRERVRTTEEEVGVKAAEITAKDALLQSKERMVQSLRREVESSRQRGLEQPQLLHPRARLQWRKCADLPVGMGRPQCVLVGDRVYVRGGVAEGDGEGNCRVFEYHSGGDEWSTLPDCPVKGFAIGQFQGHLITVGGASLEEDTDAEKVYHYKKESRQWKEFLKPLRTARFYLSIITTQSAIIACGGAVVGEDGENEPCATVEVYTTETDQWHTTDPLPISCWWLMSSVTIADTCYLLGGLDQATDAIRTVLCASISSLIRKAVAHPQQSTASPQPSGSSSSVWKTLPDTPLTISTAASLGGCLLAVGGATEDDGASSAIHMYFPPTSAWVKLTSGELPNPVGGHTAIQLSDNELFICGGLDSSGEHTKDVYIGSTTLADN